MNILVTLADKSTRLFKDVNFGTGKLSGPAHDKKLIQTDELYIFRFKDDKEVVIATYAKGRWLDCVDADEEITKVGK